MITIIIDTDNAAFSDGGKAAEVARILARIVQELRDADHFQFRGLYDINGNRVGSVQLTGKDRSL
jgi:hypothetical protein